MVEFEEDPSQQETAYANPVRLNGNRAQSLTTIHGWPSFFFGIPFAGIGSAGLLMMADVIPVDPKTIHGPKWMIWIFTGFFLYAGLSFMVHGLIGVSRKKHIQEGKRRASASPWLWDFRWSQIGFTVQKWKKPAKYLLMFLLFAGFLAPFNWWAFFSGEKSFVLWFVVGLFDVITVGIGVAFFYQLFQYFKYGNSRLLFYGFPFFLGDTLKVGLGGLPPRDQIEELELNLRFIEERYEISGSGEDRNSTVVCYQYYLETRKLQPAEIFPGPVLDMEWQLPENPEYACRMSERPAKFWELEVKAKSPGIDYYEQFLIPVYSRS